MHNYIENFDKVVSEIKNFGNFLIPYNFPKTSSSAEEDLNCLKLRDVHVDGYHVILHYNKAEHEDHYVETLQVLSKYSPFLPFSVVCKIGKKFFGDECLSLVEFYKDNRKIFCWTFVTDHDNKPVAGPYHIEDAYFTYEGLRYRWVDPKQVNFY